MMRPVLSTVFLAALVISTYAQGQAPMPAGPNTILGRVTEVESNTPVGGAIVTLLAHTDASGRTVSPDPTLSGREQPPSVNVMTTADGYFVVRSLRGGRFTATIRAFGYVNSDFPPTIIDLPNSPRPTVVALRVWKYAALGGRVVDERGEPIAGIPVSALRRMGAGAGLTLRRVVTGLTDDRGDYRLANLPPGEYTVGVMSSPTSLPASVAVGLDPSPANRDGFMAMGDRLRQSGFLRTFGCPTCISNSHEGQHVDGFVLQRPGLLLPPAPDGRPLGFANTYYPGTGRAADAGFVSLGSGASRSGVDLALRLEPTVTVSGALSGPDGPMPHVSLNLAPPATDLNDFDPQGVATAITDSSGMFVFLGITPGDYQLSGAILLDLNEMTGEARPLWTSQPLSVGDRGASNLALTMQPGIQASGRIVYKDTDVTDRPKDRVFIGWQPIRATIWRSIRAVPKADGTFRTAGDPPGRYLINTTPPPGWFWQTTTLAGRTLTDEVVELGTSEVSDVVITFGRATNVIRGQVLDASGAPDPQAAVIVFPADSSLWRDGVFSSRRSRKVHTTSTGAYDISTLSPGDYFVAALDVTETLTWQDPALLSSLVGRASKVTLGVETQQTVPLRTQTAGGTR